MVQGPHPAKVWYANRGLGSQDRQEARGRTLPRDPQTRRSRTGMWVRSWRARRAAPDTTYHRYLEPNRHSAPPKYFGRTCESRHSILPAALIHFADVGCWEVDAGGRYVACLGENTVHSIYMRNSRKAEVITIVGMTITLPVRLLPSGLAQLPI